MPMPQPGPLAVAAAVVVVAVILRERNALVSALSEKEAELGRARRELGQCEESLSVLQARCVLFAGDFLGADASGMAGQTRTYAPGVKIRAKMPSTPRVDFNRGPAN